MKKLMIVLIALAPLMSHADERDDRLANRRDSRGGGNNGGDINRGRPSGPPPSAPAPAAPAPAAPAPAAPAPARPAPVVTPPPAAPAPAPAPSPADRRDDRFGRDNNGRGNGPGPGPMPGRGDDRRDDRRDNRGIDRLPTDRRPMPPPGRGRDDRFERRPIDRLPTDRRPGVDPRWDRERDLRRARMHDRWHDPRYVDNLRGIYNRSWMIGEDPYDLRYNLVFPIGYTILSEYDYDGDTVQVFTSTGIDDIKLKVIGDDATIYGIWIKFCDGWEAFTGPQYYPVGQNLYENQSTQWINLSGSNRCISGFTVSGIGNRFDFDQSEVILLGRRRPGN